MTPQSGNNPALLDVNTGLSMWCWCRSTPRWCRSTLSGLTLVNLALSQHDFSWRIVGVDRQTPSGISASSSLKLLIPLEKSKTESSRVIGVDQHPYVSIDTKTFPATGRDKVW